MQCRPMPPVASEGGGFEVDNVQSNNPSRKSMKFNDIDDPEIFVFIPCPREENE